MSDGYYKPCPEFTQCGRLIDEYYLTGRYAECFAGHLPLAEGGYALAECQIGYFYHEGLGVERDLAQSFRWTMRAAEHGDRDAQNNLAEWFYLPGVVTEKDVAAAKAWLARAAAQGHDGAAERLAALGGA